jgi:tRNA pseudouridine55 synthase
MITRGNIEIISNVNFDDGEVLLVNKPLDWTSFDVVSRIRVTLGLKKIGHAGTLDPKADGLLIICTGKKTKSIDQFGEMEKEYTGIMEIGAVTKSFDTETEVIDRKIFTNITEENIKVIFDSFIGIQNQLPPMYSAVKVNGRRLYKDARKGKEVNRKEREIFISKFDVTSFNPPFVGFTVVCSRGTYIRSLVNDCGKKLGCGAYLKYLTRTKIGVYKIEDAIQIEQVHLLERHLQNAVADNI